MKAFSTKSPSTASSGGPYLKKRTLYIRMYNRNLQLINKIFLIASKCEDIPNKIPTGQCSAGRDRLTCYQDVSNRSLTSEGSFQLRVRSRSMCNPVAILRSLPARGRYFIADRLGLTCTATVIIPFSLPIIRKVFPNGTLQRFNNVSKSSSQFKEMWC